MNMRALTPPAVVVLTAAMWVGIAVTAAAQSDAIQVENAKPGSTDWLLTRVVRHDDEIYELGWHRRRGIEAYTSHTSVTAGDTLNVHVSTYPALYWNGYPAGFHPLTNGSGEFLMTEFSLAYWLEKEGYDVTYIFNVDTHANGKGLLRAKAFLSVGHDEYWTERMFDNVTKARDAGVSLAFLSGNSISGVVELLPSSDGRPNRVMRRAGRGFKGEQELMGATSYGVGFADWTSDTPEHWAFEGTNMKKGDRVAQLVGWEYHGAPLATHPGLVVLSEGPVYAANGEKRTGTYATTLYTARKGNLVFNAGTCWWNVVLSTPPGFQNPPRKDFRRNDPRIQRITKNILDRMISTKVTE